MSLSLLLAVAEKAHEVEPLAGRSIVGALGVILVAVFAIVLAGFGYFSPSKDDDHH